MNISKVLFLSFLFIVEISAAAVSKHTMLMKCVNTELDNMNKDYQLSPDDLGKMKRIMDKKIMQMSFDKPSEAEDRKRPSAGTMARKAIPGVPPATIDEMMDKLGQSSMRCAKSTES